MDYRSENTITEKLRWIFVIYWIQLIYYLARNPNCINIEPIFSILGVMLNINHNVNTYLFQVNKRYRLIWETILWWISVDFSAKHDVIMVFDHYDVEKNSWFTLIRYLRKCIDQLTWRFSAATLFAWTPTARFVPSDYNCVRCKKKLKVLKTHSKTAATLQIGLVRIHETIKHCDCCLEFTVPMNHESWYRIDAGPDLMFWYMSAWRCLLHVRTKNRLKQNLNIRQD